MKSRALLCAALALAAVVAGLAAPNAPRAEAATTLQLITVHSASSTSTTAVLTAWQRSSGTSPYVRVYGPITAYVGAQGIGRTSEYVSVTPAGTFGLTETYGRLANPGTTMPYQVLDPYDWWVGDVRSAYYNMHERCGGTKYCPFGIAASERMYYVGTPYNYLAVINYNRSPVVRGAGSAFFLHVTNYRPTAGCVAIPQANLIWLLRWLKPAAAPAISISAG